MTNHLEEGSPTAGCVRGILCVQNHMGFRYGPAKSRVESPQVMGQVGKPMGIAGAVHPCQTNCRSPAVPRLCRLEVCPGVYSPIVAAQYLHGAR